MLFWFAGFIALSVFDRNLHRTFVDIGLYDDYYFKGCDVVGNICGVITAACVFGGFEWYVGLLYSSSDPPHAGNEERRRLCSMCIEMESDPSVFPTCAS